MRPLDVLAILCVGLMTGSDLAVSVFVNPAIWKLDDRAQASELARSLGKVMPFWYAVGLLLLGVEACLRREEPGGRVLLVGGLLWFATIPYSLIALVPINRRLATNVPGASGWRAQHKRWDMLHRWRIGLLLGAMICLLLGLRP
jgi:uncharacterized membrane protein